MIRVQNGNWNRNPIRAFLLVLALVGFSLTGHAAKLSGWGSSGVISNGGKSFTMSPGGSASDLRIPIKTPGGGWQTAGNYGVQNGATGTTFRLGADGDVFRSMPDGTTIKYPAHIEAPNGLKVGDIAGAIAGMIGGPAGIACALACPSLIDWLKSGGSNVRFNPKSGDMEAERVSADRYIVTRGNGVTGTFTNLVEGCGWAAAGAIDQPAKDDGWTYNPSGPGGECRFTTASGLQYSAGWMPDGTSGTKWLPASMDDIAPYMSPRPDPKVVGEVLRAGGDLPLPTTGITVSGPSSVTGPTTSTINADGTREAKSTKYNFTTSGGTVTNTTNVTTTTIYNTDNSVRSTSTVTTTPTDSVAPTQPGAGTPSTTEPQEQKDFCLENPSRVGCSELDTPEGEIPKTTKEISFSQEDPIGGGSCPANVIGSFQSAPGLTGVKLLDWQGFCDAALPLRAVIMAMASIMAFFIVMPGGRVE